MKKRYLVIILLMIMLSTAGCVVIDAGPAPTPAPASATVVKLSIISHELTREAGIPEVKTKIKNVGTSTVGLVEDTMDFLDGDGNLIDSAIDNVAGLEPHQTWDLAVKCFGMAANRL